MNFDFSFLCNLHSANIFVRKGKTSKLTQANEHTLNDVTKALHSSKLLRKSEFHQTNLHMPKTDLHDAHHTRMRIFYRKTIIKNYLKYSTVNF